MARDKVSSTDHVEAGLATEVVAAEYPCPLCEKPMKDNNSRETRLAGQNLRICSSRSCRATADWTTGKAVLMNN